MMETVGYNKYKPILFGVSGKMGSGKDTLSNRISEWLEEKGKSVVSISYGNNIRDEIENVATDFRSSSIEDLSNKYSANEESILQLMNIIGDDDVYSRTENSRKAQQFWGTEVRRNQDPEYWNKRMRSKVLDLISEGINVNISDARFPNEVKLIEEMNGILIRLEVSEEVRVERIKKRDGINVNINSLRHISELALDNYKFKNVINGENEIEKVSSDSLLLFQQKIKGEDN